MRLCAPKRVTLTPFESRVRFSEGSRFEPALSRRAEPVEAAVEGVGEMTRTACPADESKRANLSVEIASPPMSGVYFSVRRAIFIVF